MKGGLLLVSYWFKVAPYWSVIIVLSTFWQLSMGFLVDSKNKTNWYLVPKSLPFHKTQNPKAGHQKRKIFIWFDPVTNKFDGKTENSDFLKNLSQTLSQY
jgi:hypothetical protein